jgi:hypothetical protein
MLPEAAAADYHHGFSMKHQGRAGFLQKPLHKTGRLSSG